MKLWTLGIAYSICDSHVSVFTRMRHDKFLLSVLSGRSKVRKQNITLTLVWFLGRSIAMPCCHFSLVTRIQHNTLPLPSLPRMQHNITLLSFFSGRWDKAYKYPPLTSHTRESLVARHQLYSSLCHVSDV